MSCAFYSVGLSASAELWLSLACTELKETQNRERWLKKKLNYIKKDKNKRTSKIWRAQFIRLKEIEELLK